MESSVTTTANRAARGAKPAPPIGTVPGASSAYDAIADLFLGEVGRAAPAVGVAAPPNGTTESSATSTAKGRVSERVTRAVMESLGTPSASSMRRMEAALMLVASIPGLRPIAARCPYAESVVFAIDRAGVCHLLVRADGASERDLTEQITRVREWLHDHVELVRLTLPENVVLDPDAEAPSHVFLTSGIGASRWLRRGIRVHIAVPGSQSTEPELTRYVEVT